MTTKLKWGAASDVGLVRAENQDRYLCNFPLFIVADGMGGHSGGEVAAQMAVDIIGREFANDPTCDGLKSAVENAHREILDKANSDPELLGMGTTITGIALIKVAEVDEICIVNVGDSRTYVMRGGELVQLTQDDSVVSELVRLGMLDESEMETHEKRHMLTRAVGVSEDLTVQPSTTPPISGERYLLCSDGLLREVSESQIGAVLRRIADPHVAAKELAVMAVARGGSDNVTVVIVDVVEDAGHQFIPASEEVPVVKTFGLSADAVPAEGGHSEFQASTNRGTTALAETPEVLGHVERSSTEDLQVIDDEVDIAPRTLIQMHTTKRRRFSFATVLAFVMGIIIVGAALTTLRWYAYSGATIKLNSQTPSHLVVWRGQDKQILWWKPQIIKVTSISVDQLRVEDRAQFNGGKHVASAEEADELIARLTANAITPPADVVTPSIDSVPPTGVN